MTFWTIFKFVLCTILAILWGGIMGIGTTHTSHIKRKTTEKRNN